MYKVSELDGSPVPELYSVMGNHAGGVSNLEHWLGDSKRCLAHN